MRVRLFTKVLLIGAVVLGLPFYWLMIDPGRSAAPMQGISADVLHRQANAIPGSKPSSIRHYDYPQSARSADMLSAGAGLRPLKVASTSFVVTAPGGNILVDAGAYARLRTNALADNRDTLVFTGTDVVMAAVLSQLNATRFSRRAILSPAQATYVAQKYFPSADADQIPISWRLTQSPIQAIAPGVVILRTPGQEPGSQMVYLETADGRRILLAGRTAPIEKSWRDGGRPAARLVTDWLEPQVREQTARWLATLQLLERQGVAVVPGIDADFFQAWDCRKDLRDPGVIPRQKCDSEEQSNG